MDTDAKTPFMPGAGLPSRVLLPGDFHAYPVRCFRWGADIIIPLCHATSFGGPHDPGDNGQTASGIRTDRRPFVAGVALPLPLMKATRGTPLPKIPWRTPIEVTRGNRKRLFPLVDIGPSSGLASGAFIDLTPAAVAELEGTELDLTTPQWWGHDVSVRIPGGAVFLAHMTQPRLFASGKE